MSSATLERSDHELVAAIRGGDERAFEALYERYHRRIQAFVAGMVKDHGRAEDVTQEVFLSALRRMRATERPIAFKPWVYEIAKNACIDAFRRTRRAEEVSFDAAEGLTPGDHRRLVGAEPPPDAAVAAKQELETLCGAFGGLSDAQHEILVMRELEGHSYKEIADRLGMSRPAVESTLFRARRRLTEEYGELVSGERCRRVQDIIATATGATLGARDARRLARHVAHCRPCRREALAAGLDRGLFERPPLRRRAAARVAAWLPFPGLLRARGAGGSGSRLAGHLPAMSDQLSAGWPKLAAGVAALAAGVGAGVGVQHPAAEAQRVPGHAVVFAPAAVVRHAAPAAHRAARRAAAGAGGHAVRHPARRAIVRAPQGTARAAAAPRARSAPASAASPAPAPAESSTARPVASAPAPTPVPSDPVRTVRPAVRDTVRRAAGAVPAAGNAVNQAGQTVQSTVNQAGQTAQSTANQAGQTAQSTVEQAGQTAQSTVDQAGQTVQSTVDQAGQTVQGAVNGAVGAVSGH